MKVEIDIPFLEEPKDLNVRVLVRLVFEAHQKAALTNQNASSAAAVIAARGSGSFRQAVVGAMMTLGASHGPIEAARMAMRANDEAFEEAVRFRQKVPGWGNSFFKDGIDPAWLEVDGFIRANFKEEATNLDRITGLLHAAGKKVWPNAAAYTAIAAKLCETPWGFEEIFFILPRIPAWAKLCL